MGRPQGSRKGRTEKEKGGWFQAVVEVEADLAVSVEHIHACIERSTIGSDKNAIDSTACVRSTECARLCKAPKSIVALGSMHLRWQPMHCGCDYSDQTSDGEKERKTSNARQSSLDAFDYSRVNSHRFVSFVFGSFRFVFGSDVGAFESKNKLKKIIKHFHISACVTY